ncbi:MAG: NAD(P)H-hydrate dehydratase [Bacteroidales bacterium]
MKVLKSSQVKEVDAYTIENEPILSVNLMERAAGKCTEWLIQHIGIEKRFFIFVGPGNNGGDGLAVARQLAEKGRDVKVYIVKITDKLSPDAELNLQRLKDQKLVQIDYIRKGTTLPEIPDNSVVIDALFGSGLNRPLEGFPAEIVKFLNQGNQTRIAIDIPSGLFGEDNSSNIQDHIFRADYTLTFQFPSLSFMCPENEPYVGNWRILDIGLSKKKIDEMDSPYFLITENFIKNNLNSRKRFAHKGHFGHPLLINGSYGKMGAAILAAKAALRAGSGLVTTHLPVNGYAIMQTAVPEAMLDIDISEIIFSEVPDLNNFSNVGCGCGIGMKVNSQKALGELIQKEKRPLVLDADALNILAENKEWLNLLPENSILTPHPKEFERLTGETQKNHYDRIQTQRNFASKYRILLVLKGGNTTIALPDGACYINTNGNPGMATAGSGDVLTGIITSLVGQGYSPNLAAIIGVFLHGMAGDIAAEQNSKESLIATDIIEFLGDAYKRINSA